MAQETIVADKPDIRITTEVKPKDPAQAETRSADIVIKDCNLSYGDNHVLHDISMDIEDRRVTAFIGPSGCGKSTLLRCLNRMNDLIDDVRVTGTIRVKGLDLYSPSTDVIEVRRRIGMVFQKSNPFPKSIFDVEIGSSADVGSSSSSTSGFTATPRAMHRRCCWPPDSDKPLAASLSLTSSHNAARRSADSTRPSSSLLDSFS